MFMHFQPLPIKCLECSEKLKIFDITNRYCDKNFVKVLSVFNRVLSETSVIMTSHMVAGTSVNHLHCRGARFVETAGLSKPQIHKGDTERLVRRNSGSAMESAYVKNCVG